MDAPNAPNPANPNAQDQFVDVVQGPTDTIDSYVLRMSQVAAMLNYGENADIRKFQKHPSILTLFDFD